MAYERLVADDEDNGSDTVVDAQGRAHKRRLVREKLERLAWIFASIALVSFGDGSTNLVTAVFHRAKAARLWFLLTAISMAANFGILCYLVIFLKFHRRGSKWEDSAAWAMPASTLFGATSFVGVGVLLWPIYGWATPVIEVVLFMGQGQANVARHPF